MIEMLWFAIGFVAALVKFFGLNTSKIHTEKYYSYLLLFFVTYINIVYILIGTPDCTHLFANFGFQHTMAIISAFVLMAWIIFKKNKTIKEN